jgi:hypothetical protein|tara:strand:+ start:250 stop:969 length:720 start_codon:yes stop_codon:yes gene_type:complete
MIREARRTQNSKQDKIQVVKSQPSVNSLREGQEVIYISKSNRLERYRKEQGRLWTSYMYPTQDETVDRDLIIGRNIISNNKKIDPTKLGVFYHKIYDDDVSSNVNTTGTGFNTTANDKDMFENLPSGTYIFILSANVQVDTDGVEGVLKVRTHTPNVSGTTISGDTDIPGGLRIHTGTDTTAYDSGDGTDLLQFMVDMQIVTLTENKDVHMQFKRQAGSASGRITFSDINLVAILIGGH